MLMRFGNNCATITGVICANPTDWAYVDHMKRPNSFAFAVVALLSLSTMVKAEIVHPGGDGYFCTSKGYLAFDYKQNEIEGRVANEMHLLKIVRFGPEHRIYFAGEVSLPVQFGILWMDCDAERIEIAGPKWPRGLDGPFTKCDIKIGPPTTDVRSAECVDDVVYGKPRTEVPGLEITIQSENINDPPPIALEAPTDPDHVYQLLRHLTQKRVARGGLSKTKAEVVELDQKGTILKRLVIYEYVRFEAAD